MLREKEKKMRIKKLNVLTYVIFILVVLVQIDAADKEFEKELPRCRTGRPDSSSKKSVDQSRDINNNEQSEPNRNSIVHGEPNKSSFNKDRR